jgi:hypothetical protein
METLQIAEILSNPLANLSTQDTYTILMNSVFLKQIKTAFFSVVLWGLVHLVQL